MTKSVVGLYDNLTDAQAVVKDLTAVGIVPRNISLVTHDPERRYAAELDDRQPAEGIEVRDTEAANGATAGAVTGGLVGGLSGLMLGLGALAIPGLGPIIAAGPLVAGLLGAGIGATAGGLLGALVGWGIPEDHAHYYAEALRRGGTLVVVQADSEQIPDINQIMNRHNPVDIEERAAFWRANGWAGYDPESDIYTPEEITQEREAWTNRPAVNGDDFRTRAYDPYQVYKSDFEAHFNQNYADSAHTFELYEPAYRFGYLTAHDEHYRGHAWETVEPQLREKWQAEAHDTVWDDVKDIVRHARNTIVSGYYDVVRDYDYYEGDFRDHFYTHYSGHDHPYSYYQPAYRYGYRLARDPHYRDRDWTEVEPEIKDDFSRIIGGAWEDFRDAVSYAWQQVRQVGSEDYTRYQDDFERHFNTNYTARSGGYQDYQSAYRLGYSLNKNGEFQGMAWEEVEPIAQRRWEASEPELVWEDIKSAVQHAWRRVNGWADGFKDHRDDLYRHYESHYPDSSFPYADYEAAYAYGYSLAQDARYRDQSWEKVEPIARVPWEETNQGTWDQFKEAIQYAWNRITGADSDTDQDDEYPRYREDYHRHYKDNYVDSGYPFTDYERAYRYGYMLTREPRYLNLDWPAIEPELREYWESEYRHQIPWDRYRDAAYYGWDVAKTRMQV